MIFFFSFLKLKSLKVTEGNGLLENLFRCLYVDIYAAFIKEIAFSSEAIAVPLLNSDKQNDS